MAATEDPESLTALMTMLAMGHDEENHVAPSTMQLLAFHNDSQPAAEGAVMTDSLDVLDLMSNLAMSYTPKDKQIFTVLKRDNSVKSRGSQALALDHRTETTTRRGHGPHV